MAKVKFGNVVKEYKGKIDQKNNPYEFYVAGDHMDTDDLTIRRRGRFATDDVGPAFIREFKKGQVLYGSRRTYLRKIAVADFDGVTANTTFVLETKDESILRQRLLPFIMYTESFTEWSIKKSKGSTNPYVLFKDLADYEFELPDIGKQDELVELLWSMIDTRDAYNNLIVSIDELVKSQFIERFGGIDEQHIRPLSEVCTLITDGTHNPPKFVNEGIPFLLVSNITGDVITYDTTKFITEATYNELIKRTPVEIGDLLLSTVGSYGHPALVEDSTKFSFQRHIALLKPNKTLIDSRFLHTSILAPDAQRQIDELVQGVAQKTLNLSAIKKIHIPVPSMDAQAAFIRFVRQSDKSKFELRKALAELTAMYKRIIQENLV